MRSIYFSALLAVFLGGCASYTPPPGWPDGQERPINSKPVAPPSPVSLTFNNK